MLSVSLKAKGSAHDGWTSARRRCRRSAAGSPGQDRTRYEANSAFRHSRSAESSLGETADDLAGYWMPGSQSSLTLESGQRY